MAERPWFRGALLASVRIRVTALAAVLLAAVLASTAVVLVTTQERLLIDGVDDNLRSRADDLEALIATSGPSDITLSAAPDTVAQLVAADGTVLAASHSSVDGSPLTVAPADVETITSVGELPVDDDEFRLLSRPLDDGRVLHVAQSIDDIREGIRTLTAALAVLIPFVTLVLAVIVWWLVGRTLRPVEAIRAEVASIGGDAVHRRVPVPPGHDEVARLARTMNDMLTRVEEAQTRQRRFATDASHELRSPLARMRTELEVDLAHPDGADPYETHRSVLEEAQVLQRMIEDLLELARGEAGLPASATTVDLDDIVLREADAFRSRDGPALDVSGVSAAQVLGDELQLGRAVRNLVDNAATHAAGRVALALGEVDGAARLTVTDDGPGIAAADHERVFERFTRLDEARSRRDGGSGLGLPISREIAERHGGTLVVDPSFTDGARFVLRIPLIGAGPG